MNRTMTDMRAADLTAPVDARDHTRGSSRGPQLVVYGDFECPFTAAAMRAIDVLVVRGAIFELVFRYFPLREIHPRQRAYLMFASANLEIASHPWVFETEQLNGLRQRGLVFADATLESIALCLRRFVSSSPRMQCYVKSLVPRDWAGWRFVEVPPPAARSETTKAA